MVSLIVGHYITVRSYKFSCTFKSLTIFANVTAGLGVTTFTPYEMFCLLGMSTIKEGFFISNALMIWSLVSVVAVAVRAITGTLLAIEQISFI